MIRWTTILAAGALAALAGCGSDDDGGGPFYDIAYVSTAVTPNRLYDGTARGAAPATRPTVLDSVEYWDKQP